MYMYIHTYTYAYIYICVVKRDSKSEPKHVLNDRRDVLREGRCAPAGRRRRSRHSADVCIYIYT